ncbi:hypothetical protein [Legionella quateirensis]|uniref:Chitin-binding protein n=1 Tax=Legionella quateirensis TaxID=45072 RepID=A0A378KY36_9GAMM|nr:hypothetical protein [Legionella quateirensis]KTD43395.1 chitin-binding protein [Legionella quateirensis]STY18278.1 chitin-binding protein [Legionella quateirensis]
MFFNRFSILFIACFFMFFQQSTHSHGLIEKPGSREYFCGKITQPHHIEPGNTIPFKECRPILTKEDGSYNQDVYQFTEIHNFVQDDAIKQPSSRVKRGIS